jgi:hypothetical protein
LGKKREEVRGVDENPTLPPKSRGKLERERICNVGV